MANPPSVCHDTKNEISKDFFFRVSVVWDQSLYTAAFSLLHVMRTCLQIKPLTDPPVSIYNASRYRYRFLTVFSNKNISKCNTLLQMQ